MDHSVFENADNLLQFYEIQAENFRMRHTAIWTEVQHYTWVLSVVLGAGPLAAVGQSTLSPTQLGFLLFLPIVGMAIAIIAFLIIRRDFIYYTQADSRLLYIEKQLGVVSKKGFIDPRFQRANNNDFTVEKDVATQIPIGLKSLIKLRIRALILSTFILYALAGLCEAIYFAFLLFSH